MKKTITVITMMIFGLTSYSQILLGESYRDIKRAMLKEGYIVEENKAIEGGVGKLAVKKGYSILARDINEVKVFLFDESNFCYMYKRSNLDDTYSGILRSLSEGGFLKNSDGSFSNKTYTLFLYQIESTKSWMTVMIINK